MTTRIMMRDILTEVAAKHRLRPRDILGKCRVRPIVVARQEVMFRCRSEAMKSYPQIGRFLSKDHTTVIHGFRKHRERVRP
jgi:chromosomal replication initiator protein